MKKDRTRDTKKSKTERELRIKKVDVKKERGKHWERHLKYEDNEE